MLLPILPWYDVYLLISGLVAPSPLLPILATDQRKPDTTQTYTKHASESNAASIHQNSRFHSAPQTYNKQQACIRIQHIPNPCCTISARWKEWNWFFPPGAGVNSPPCAANQKSDATLVKIALVHILGFLWIKFYLWTHIPCVSDIWLLVFCFLMMHITSNLLNKTSFE